MMPRHTTAGHSIQLIRLAAVVASLAAAGCPSAPPGDGEPSAREVRKQLAPRLTQTTDDHLTLTELHGEGEGRFTGEARGVSGAVYRVTATAKGRQLTYQAEAKAVPGKTTQIFRGTLPLPEPSFEDRYPQAMQWLRGALCVLHSAGVVWPVLGRFGLRRRYSPRTEKFLTLFAAVNLALAMIWGYEFVTGLDAA
jgi:hypothetical protein